MPPSDGDIARLAEIRDRWSRATPGPWRWDDGTNLRGPHSELIVSVRGHGYADHRVWCIGPTAEAIEHAPGDVAFLLALLGEREA